MTRLSMLGGAAGGRREGAGCLAAGGGEGVQGGGVRGWRAHGPGHANGGERGRGQRKSGCVAVAEGGWWFGGGLGGGLLEERKDVASAGGERAGTQRGGFG